MSVREPGGGNDGFENSGLCSVCGFLNEPETFACLRCDHILDETDVTICSECGFENGAELVECLSCGHALPEAGLPAAGRVDSVEVFSTWAPAVAQSAWEQLRAAGVTCEILDSGKTVSVAEIALAAGSGETRTGPLSILAPPDQAGRAEELLGQIDLDEQTPFVSDTPGDPDGEFCPDCETPYRLEDYDPRALRIYCAACRAELPRHGSSRLGGGSRRSPASRD